MRKVAIFKNGANRAIRIPKDLDFEGVNELEILREGNTLILRPVKADWDSFLQEPKADADFLADRPDIVEEGRVKL
ncbi:MAG: type II toxin-antitoxin system VapB family antitoxin [Enterobacteriaceae bacterium]